ncbi:MAG TPA: serine protease [Anaerolineales bacterium]|nr:serine protease [Anaerolineales bacterium]
MSHRQLRFLLFAIALVLAACAPAPAPTATSAPQPTATISQFRNPTVPFEAVVQIWAEFYDETGELQIGWTGSGTIISADGLILTNAHVVLPDRYFPVDALAVAMTISQDTEPEPRYYAEVLQADASLDIAVIRVTADYNGNPVDRASLNLPHVLLGNSDQLNLGDSLTILGYPGIGGDTVTLTRGEVSGFTSQPVYGQRAFIKTSATIAGGNSGGLAVDASGQLIGVPTQLGYGGEDQYVDCRVLADTNRDGFVDDFDSCVPTGGFINALRPVALALPLIEAALRGEVNIVGAEEPVAVVEPVSSGTSYTDDFSNESSGWDIYTTETGSVYYSNGEYIVEDIAGDVYYSGRPYLNFDNSEMSIDVRLLKGNGEIDMGCRYVDPNNNYEFRLTTDGRAGISKWLNAEYVNLVEPQLIGIDWSVPHRATVSCQGSHLSLSVDGQIVAEVNDDSFASGDLALAVYTEEGVFTVAFDNFEAGVPSGAPQASEGETVINEDFSDNSLGWDESSETDFARYLQDGKYVIEVYPAEFIVWDALEGQDFENIVINVDINIEQRGLDGDIGILCRYLDADNHYALEVTEDGYYSIWKRVNGEVINIVDWAASALIPTDGSSFVLNASCDGAQLSVGINGNLLATGTDTEFVSGGVGMLAGTWNNGGLVVSFDNFEVIEY